MKKFVLPAIAAGAVAIAAVLTPTLAATAAPVHVAAASASKHYTLSVTGNGKYASVVWTTAVAPKKGSTATVPTPVAHTTAKAHEPWTKHVTPSADLYEVVAIQTTGSSLHCTIKNTHGTVIASSYSKGKNTIVTCIVAKDALLAGVGSSTGSGSTSGSGTTMGGSIASSLQAALR